MKRILTFILFTLLFLSVNGQIGRYPFSVNTASSDTSTLYPAFKVIYDAMPVKPRWDTVLYENAIVKSLDSLPGNVWDRIKVLYVCAQGRIVTAKLNWIDPTEILHSYNLTDPGSTNPSFIPYQGFDFDGSTDYLSTGWIPTDSILVSGYIGTNKTTVAAWVLSINDGTYILGALHNGYYTRFSPFNSNAIKAIINGVENSDLGAQTATTGFIAATRRGKTELEGYYNGGSTGTDNEVSYNCANIHIPIFIGAFNNEGISWGHSDGIISIILIMDAITDTEATDIYTIFHHYMTHIGL